VFDELCAWENLLRAYRRASKGKRGHRNVAAFEFRLEDNLIALQDELTSGTYRPGPYVNFVIHEPKRRLISAAPFRDRVVHHALCNLIEPVFERTFVSSSYANRVGKGSHRALGHAQRLARRYRYVLRCDVRQFFPSIDHQALRALLSRKLPDPQVMNLIDRILASGAHVHEEAFDMVFFRGDDLFAALRPRGLPIGNLTSQFWANVYMNPLDHFVKRELRCQGYVRYVDDMLLFANEKGTLHEWLRGISERLAWLRLVLHEAAHAVPVTEGFPFLGFTVFPWRRRLKRRKGIHFQRRLKRLVLDNRARKVTDGALLASLRGWINHVRFANTVGLRTAVLRGCRLLP